MARNESPEESLRREHAPTGGKASRGEGGFSEGEHGRGPTPYLRGHSKKPNGHPIEAHFADTGRGGSGVAGKGDDFKGRHTQDVEHPQSHSEFEALGASDSDEG